VVDGRDAALSDLIANTLGGLLGELTWRVRLWWPAPRTAIWSTAAGSVVLGLMAGAPGRWFVPAGPDGPYFPHLDPRTAPFPADASLHRATWNGRDIRCCPDASSSTMQAEAAAGRVRVEVTASLHSAPRRRGRLLTVWDARSTPVVAVGVTPTRAWASVASPARASGARDFAVGIRPPTPWRTGDSVQITVEATPGTWQLRLSQKALPEAPAGASSSERSGALPDVRTVTAVVRQRPLLAAYYFLPGFTDVQEPHGVGRWAAFLLPAVLLGWSAGFLASSLRWCAGPVAAGLAMLWGHPWGHRPLATFDLAVMTMFVALATAATRRIALAGRSS
jgi:hypothetical protein